jgi:ribonuclease HI
VSDRAEIFTDGGCLGNPGPGAWAFVIHSADGNVERSGFQAQTTNNRMELTAVLEALKTLAGPSFPPAAPADVTTDSQYVQKGITEWIHAWVRNGWKTSAKKPVKNADLWRELWDRSKARVLSWHWVMGHSGEHWNEVCHRLVEGELKRQA